MSRRSRPRRPGRGVSPRKQAVALAAAVPLAADLLALALGAGLTPYLALEVAARWAPPPVAVRFAAVLAAARERRLVEALEAEAAASPPLGAVLRVLIASERLGAPAASSLARLAVEGRARARQEAMARARTVPVRLLFPLVFLVLPAFLVLTVAPVLLAGFAR
jgi:Flp pilus assembly protein TadB